MIRLETPLHAPNVVLLSWGITGSWSPQHLWLARQGLRYLNVTLAIGHGQRTKGCKDLVPTLILAFLDHFIA